MLAKPIGNQRTDEEKNQMAECVRSDMDHLRQGFKVLNDNKETGFMCSGDTITFFDIMVYIEISQILAMYSVYFRSS